MYFRMHFFPAQHFKLPKNFTSFSSSADGWDRWHPRLRVHKRHSKILEPCRPWLKRLFGKSRWREAFFGTNLKPNYDIYIKKLCIISIWNQIIILLNNIFYKSFVLCFLFGQVYSITSHCCCFSVIISNRIETTRRFTHVWANEHYSQTCV